MSTNEDSKPIAGTALITKACDILELIGSHHGHADQTMLAQRTQIPRATLYRILAALSARSLIRNDPVTQSFVLGFRFLELAQNVWSSADLASIASSELRRLRDLTGETSYLAIQQDKQVLALGRFDGAHSRRSSSRLGVLKPMYCTSQGKAILAHLSDAQVDAVLSAGTAPLTAKTITDPARLRSQLAIVRARGFAIDDEEILEGTRCVGAAILDEAGRPIAAISVAGPAYRITPERAEQLGQELAEAARRISAQLKPLLPSAPGGDAQPVRGSVSVAFHGADPFWDTVRQRLVWTDRLAPALHEWDAAGRVYSLESLDSELECSFHSTEGVVLLCRDRLVLLRPNGEIAERDRASRDAVTALAISLDGEAWAATISETAATARVGRLLANGEVEQSFQLAGRIDGLAFAPDGTLYASSAEHNTVHALTVQGARKRLFANLPKAAGQPTALAVDATNRLWLAMSDGWSVVRLDESGEFERTLAIPVPRPTGLAFAGDNLECLYVTSSRAGLNREALLNAPMSGRLLSLDAGVGGTPIPLSTFSWN